MEIWKLEIDFSKYESFKLINEEAEFLREFKESILKGSPLNNRFNNNDLRIELVEGHKQSDLPKFWSVSGTTLFSDKAYNCLKPLIDKSVEFIQLSSESETYYLVNILNIIDAIDSKNSLFRKLDTGLIVGIKKYSFLKEKINNESIFKVSLNGRTMSTEIFVSTEFKNIVQDNMLLGFKFEKVWSN